MSQTSFGSQDKGDMGSKHALLPVKSLKIFYLIRPHKLPEVLLKNFHPVALHKLHRKSHNIHKIKTTKI